MKVLIVSPKFHPVIGGGETYVLNLARSLHGAGVEVSVAVEPHKDGRADMFDFEVHEVAGLSDSRLDVINGTSNLYDLIQKIKPDLIHVHGYFALLAAGFAGLNSIPIIASIHSTPVWGERIVGGMSAFEVELTFARNIVRSARPVLLTAANDVYAEAAKKVVSEEVPVRVVPYPVDVDYFSSPPTSSFREEYGIPEDAVLITVPSRVIERKGIKEAVFALARLPDNFFMCLPGAAEPLDVKYWESIVASDAYEKVKNRLVIPDKKPTYNQMSALYGVTQIVAMPSYYEGAPVATVEAMASGRPFVGADSQGINGFIKHEVNGLLVPQKNSEALADAILRMNEDGGLADRLSRQAQKDIAYLSWEVQLPKTLEIYKEVLGSWAHM